MNILKIVNIQHNLSLLPKFTVIFQISRRCYNQRCICQRFCSVLTNPVQAMSTAEVTANARTCYVTTTITHYLVYQTTTVTTITNKYLLNKVKYLYLCSSYCSYLTTLLLNNYVELTKLNAVVKHKNVTRTQSAGLVGSVDNLLKMWKFATRTFRDTFGNNSNTAGGVTSHCRCTLNNLFNSEDQQLQLQATTICDEKSTNDTEFDNDFVVTDVSTRVNKSFSYCLYKNLFKISLKCTNTLQSLGWYVNHFISLQPNDKNNHIQIKPTTPSVNKQLLIFDTNNYKKIGTLSDLSLLTPKLPKAIITNALNPQIIETFQLKNKETCKNNNTDNKIETRNSCTDLSSADSITSLKSNITKNDDLLTTTQHQEIKENTDVNDSKTTQSKIKNEKAIEDAAARFAFVTGVLENQLGAAYLKQQQKTNNSNLDIALEHFEAGTLYKNASAAFNLGLCYELGIGTKQNYQAAAKCYQIAIELGGHTKAMYNLAIYYIKGLGNLPQDFNLAYQLFINAAQKGHLQSIQALRSVQEYNNNNKEETNKVHEQQQAVTTC